MFKRYLLSSVAHFSPPGEEGADVDPNAGKTPAQIEREKIQVTTSAKTGEDDPKSNEGAGDEGAEGESNEQDNEEGKGETEEEGEEVTAATTDAETNDEENDPEKLKRTIARLQRRLDKTTGSQKDLRKELADAKAKLEAQGEEVLTKADVDKEADRIANEKIALKEFEDTCNKLNKDALAIDKTFSKKVNAMAEDIGPIPGAMIGVLGDLDNGGAVLNYLTDNVEIAEEVYVLSPAKMAVKLAKISNELLEKAKPKPKKISQAPDPITPVRTGSSGGPNLATVLNGTNGNIRGEKMENYIKLRNKQDEEKRRARLGR